MGTEDADSDDVRRVLEGDLAAFEGIVRRWQGRLVGLAWRFCRDRTTAEDMAQDAFLKAFRSLAAFRGDAAFSTWLTAIALNTYRSRLRAEGPPLLALDEAQAFGVGGGLEQALDGRQRDERVRHAVLTLPARYREPILMFYFHDMDVAEAARTLGLPEGTLKARLRRGRELLKRRCPESA